MDNSQQTTHFLFYGTEDGKTSVQVIADADSETIWTTQKGMSEIFGVDRSVITKHLGNIFESGELVENSVCAKNALTASDGKLYQTNYYNLDAIISVGYRVNSAQATRFRIWATQILKEYLVKGFALDDERLKQGGKIFNKDYFDELLERIREIRASERMFYQKVTDIFAQCSIDYDSKSVTAQTFFKTIQNKLEWAITRHTAPELIAGRADANKPNMNLTNWKGQGNGGKILLSDVKIAKSYLTKKELTDLNSLVSMFLEYAENLAKRGREMTMAGWVLRLDKFLEFNEYEVLNHKGDITKDRADAIATIEYKKYRVKQDKEYKSDFDKIVESIQQKHIPNETISPSPISDFDQKLTRALDYNPKEYE